MPRSLTPSRSALTAVLATATLALGVMLLSRAAHAQETLPGFAETIDVRVVNIEVVVTDRQGNRVHGLSKDDFELRVDGKVVPIDYFTEIADGMAVERTGDTQTNSVPALGDDQELRTNVVLFIDDFFSLSQDRNRVLENLEQQLTQLPDGDRVAVVAFNGKQLDLLTGWTDDKAEVRSALAQARQRPAYGLQRLSELRTNDTERKERQDLDQLLIERVIANGGDAPDERKFKNLDPVEYNYINRLSTQVDRSVLAAVSTLRSFAGAPGRKVMLLLSGGWPYSPAEYALSTFDADVEDTYGAATDSKLIGRSALFRPLSDTANRLGYTIYPVDVPGLDKQYGTDASISFGSFTPDTPTLTAGGTAIDRELHVHAGYDYLARQTGGEPIINAMRDRALSEAIADTRTFYWLGFNPERKGDDARHDIEVRVLRDGLRVRSRESFVDLSRSTEVTMVVESALLFGDPPSSKPLAVRFGQPNKRGIHRMRIPLEVGIPLDEILMVYDGESYHNEVEVRITVMDKNGARSETSLEKVLIEGPEKPKPGQMFFWQTTLVLREQQHRIVIAVYDPLTGEILSATGDLAL